MAKWICKKPVNYGRRDYSPDAADEKSRVINLPSGIEPDAVIKANFQLEGTAPKLVEEPKKEPTPMNKVDANSAPDLLKKLEAEAQVNVPVEVVEPKGQSADDIFDEVKKK